MDKSLITFKLFFFFVFLFFFKFLLQSDNELLVSEMQKKKGRKKMGVTDFVSEIKRVENYLILKNRRT